MCRSFKNNDIGQVALARKSWIEGGILAIEGETFRNEGGILTDEGEKIRTEGEILGNEGGIVTNRTETIAYWT